jgi:superfamily II DNA/RNA helicase
METLNQDASVVKQIEINSWDDLNINPRLLRGIYSCGYEKPSPIQQKSIVHMLNKKDVLAQAQSGTGKTGAFSIAALQILNIKKLLTQVLILSPTRELTTQTGDVIKTLGTFMPGLIVQTLFGGYSQEKTNSFLNKNIPHIICGCPGRVFDMIAKDKISTSSIKLIILDEADELLSYSFKDQVYNIFQYLNNNFMEIYDIWVVQMF